MFRVLVVALCAVCIASFASAASAQEIPAGLTLVVVEKGFDRPVQFLHDPTGRNFIVEQKGRVWMLVDGKKAKEPYLDIEPKVLFDGNEAGFLSIAFHPKFAQNGRMFVNYVHRKSGGQETIISEFKVDPKADKVDASTEKDVMVVDQPQLNHNGGSLKFGPDGMMYIGFGDGGGGNDNGGGHVKGGNGQYFGTLLGKILRINVDGKAPYEVPKDNPFVTRKDAKPEIWALGLRNPWRFSFDRKTGELFAGDVGQGEWEEIDVITKGGNYGWRVKEGTRMFVRDGQQPTSPITDPIAEYSHKDGGLSVTGGYVYRGKLIPELQGVYIYADFSSGRYWGLRYDNGKATPAKEFAVTVGKKTGRNLLQTASFGEDKDGELFVCDLGRGQILRVTVTK